MSRVWARSITHNEKHYKRRKVWESQFNSLPPEEHGTMEMRKVVEFTDFYRFNFLIWRGKFSHATFRFKFAARKLIKLFWGSEAFFRIRMSGNWKILLSNRAFLNRMNMKISIEIIFNSFSEVLKLASPLNWKIQKSDFQSKLTFIFLYPDGGAFRHCWIPCVTVVVCHMPQYHMQSTT